MFLSKQAELGFFINNEPDTPSQPDNPLDTTILRLEPRSFLKLMQPQVPDSGLNALNQFVHGANIVQAFQCAEFYHREMRQNLTLPPGAVSEFAKYTFHLLLYSNIQTLDKAIAAKRLIDSTLSGTLSLKLESMKPYLEVLYPGKPDSKSRPFYLARGSLDLYLQQIREIRSKESAVEIQTLLQAARNHSEQERGRRLRRFGKQLHKAEGLREFKEDIMNEFSKIRETIRERERALIVEDVLAQIKEKEGKKEQGPKRKGKKEKKQGTVKQGTAREERATQGKTKQGNEEQGKDKDGKEEEGRRG